MVQRTLTVREIEDQWGAVRKAIASSSDAVIVEEGGKPNVVVVTFDWYQQALEREREEQFAFARQEFEALAASIGDRNSDLTPEEIEELGNRFVNEPDDAYLVDEPADEDPASQ